MHLMYYMDAEGKRVYTLKKATPEGEATKSAHPGKTCSGKSPAPHANCAIPLLLPSGS
jgi:hypothetical protein